ncbi:hypothetical protein QNI16_06950 [Cytophagaceae bacterium YF14B1]|uniref:Uncharacterized protein n=1 Tax=Xanthocytophaga flava TaxID=3048013 RepID=A0AAE3QKC9_9BACT|nr:hypothetical protein [Xanthocytophaga flavus]MDJ1480216.1 hypothetical protein [Xanthocytophaga flavus]
MQQKNYSYRVLYSQKYEEALTLAHTHKLIRWYVKAEPLWLSEEVFEYSIELRPMDEDRFMILNQKDCIIEIRRWITGKLLQTFQIPENPDRQLADAVYLPKHQYIIAGGGWDTLYFIDLQTGLITRAYEAQETFEYITYLSVNDDETLLTHSDINMFNCFHLRSIDFENKKLTPAGRFDGDLRCHRDVIKFIPGSPSFVHVWMDMYRKQVITCWRYEENTLHKEWEHRLPMIFHEHTLQDEWRSGLSVDYNIIVGAGQHLLEVASPRLEERIAKHWILPDLIQDIESIPRSGFILLATEKGLIKWDTNQPATRNVRIKLEPL